MPPELVTVLTQYPVVGLVFLAAWVMLKWADRRFDGELAREQERSRERAVEKDRQIGWLEGELTRLRSRNTQLQNQLDDARWGPSGGKA